jgi:hypothetical protein
VILPKEDAGDKFEILSEENLDYFLPDWLGLWRRVIIGS